MVELSAEQKYLIALAKEGKNVLVDACIGSGKTTTIQQLCDELDDKRILYLTYNKLLKIDAKQKIQNRNATVTNYHGYAWSALAKKGVRVGVSDTIQAFIAFRPFQKFDVLILDEYQDIDEEISQMLKIIKENNPNIQIIAVGDMEQKIYDKTSLDVKEFIEEFLGEHEQAYFTKCFRINKAHGEFLGRVWKKQIDGVNDSCKIENMTFDEAKKFLSEQNPADVLCLGQRTGKLSNMLNELEREYPDLYNKYTVYASIRNNDEYMTEADLAEKLQEAAIFTTYDSSKGLERPICVIFDFTEDYWRVRSSYAGVRYEILRNIFCVASSRGKQRIIYVFGGDDYSYARFNQERDNSKLSERTLSESYETRQDYTRFPYMMSSMFDFKYKEDIERCYDMLEIEKVNGIEDQTEIMIPSYDGFIDLSPCIGIYQEASYFTKYDIDKQIEFINQHKGDRKALYVSKKDSVDTKILRITAFETQQNRYVAQVQPPFVTDEQRDMIHARLAERLSKDARVQTGCNLNFTDGIRSYEVNGRTDAIVGDTVYELKFVSELNHEHFLQCACYVVALANRGIKQGFLWNVHTNTAFIVRVPEPERFLQEVFRTITKGYVRNGELIESYASRTRKIVPFPDEAVSHSAASNQVCYDNSPDIVGMGEMAELSFMQGGFPDTVFSFMDGNEMN